MSVTIVATVVIPTVAPQLWRWDCKCSAAS